MKSKDMSKRTINILLVEDDEVDMMNLKRAFKKVKVTNPLFVAINGIDWEMIKRQKFLLSGP